MHGDGGGRGRCVTKLPDAQAYVLYTGSTRLTLLLQLSCVQQATGASLLDLDLNIDLVVHLCGDVRRIFVC